MITLKDLRNARNRTSKHAGSKRGFTHVAKHRGGGNAAKAVTRPVRTTHNRGIGDVR
jgi:hypothetical protein